MTQNGSPPDEVKLEFPCQYPIKIIGDNTPDFIATVKAEVLHLVDDTATWKAKESKNGKFISLTLIFVARDEEHIKEIHDHIKDIPGLSMVL